MNTKTAFLALLFIFILTSIATAQEYSIDISGIGNEEYSPGEDLTFKIILLENNTQIEKQVNYKITDALNKKEINGEITSGQEKSITIEKNFSSGIWTITANYIDTKVERVFIVKENSEVEFSIKNDELTIKNTGNVRYTKTVQIKIGDVTNSYVQNIKAGDKKVLKLMSKDGRYNIEVTDGETTIKKEDVQLFSTGNVVGAIDKNLIGYTGLYGVEDIKKADNLRVPLKKLPFSLIFIAITIILATLVFVERKNREKK